MGFSFMLVVEQIAGNDHFHAHPLTHDAFDLESITETRIEAGRIELDRVTPAYDTGGSKKAIKLTLGLVIHSLADGFALGASAISNETTARSSRSELPLVVFFALLVHKGKVKIQKSLSHSFLNIVYFD